VQAGLHGGRAQAERVGDGLARVALDVPHDQDPPLVGGQLGYRRGHPFRLQPLQDVVLRRDRGPGRHQLRFAAQRLAGPPQALVAHDPEHPGHERTGGPQGPDLAVQDDQRFLRGVLGVLGRGAQRAREPLYVRV
jgi:hypothetical protein